MNTTFPTSRLHTYCFLRHARRFHPVYLSTQIDMTGVKAVRAASQNGSGLQLSSISFVVSAIARVIARYPAANVSVLGRVKPRLAHFERVHAKVAFDKVLDETRVVMSGTIEDADHLSLEDIQQKIAYYRDRPTDEIPEFAPARRLHELPAPIGQWLYDRALARPSWRQKLQGSFAVTSLGHRPVHSFYPITSTSTCFGLGAIEDTPVVRDGALVIRPVLQLSMVFDHAAMDGALAADVLWEVKGELEKFGARREDDREIRHAA